MKCAHLRSTARRAALSGLLVAGCGGGGSDDAATTPPRLVTFHGEQAPFAGFGYDTGLQPMDSLVQVRFMLAAAGGLTLDARALSTSAEAVAGLKGSGRFALDGRITVQATLKVDLPAYQYEGPIEGAPDLNVVLQGEQTFDPFLVGGGVDLTVAVPETELAAIPLEAATGIPGTLHVKASGTIRSRFAGECAATSAAGVAYLGTTTTGGPLVLSGTVDIEIPLVGTQTYGPFVMPEIQVGPFVLPLDLGVQSPGEAASGGEAGEAAQAGVCGGGVPDGGVGGQGGGGAGGGGLGGRPVGGGSDGGSGGGSGGSPIGGDPVGGGSGGAGSGGGGGGGQGGEPPPADPSLVGQACDTCPGNPCFDTGAAGLCSFECTQDMGACAPDDACVPVADGTAYCFGNCTPALGGNTCAGEGTACDLGGVCLPACRADTDCEAGAYCNLDLGLCFSVGSPFARVGDACAQDADCPRNGLCLTNYPGGRCATRGCDLEGGFACPQDALCVGVAEGFVPNVYLSICLPMCSPDDPNRACRAGETCTDVGEGASICVPPQ